MILPYNTEQSMPVKSIYNTVQKISELQVKNFSISKGNQFINTVTRLPYNIVIPN